MSRRELPQSPCPEVLHHKTAAAPKFRTLQESPRLQKEVELPNASANGLRQHVCTLKPPCDTRGRNGGVVNWNAIIYLYGDERRAIRKAIEENEEYITHYFTNDGTNNAFAQMWDEPMYRLLCEEWEAHRRNNDAE